MIEVQQASSNVRQSPERSKLSLSFVVEQGPSNGKYEIESTGSSMNILTGDINEVQVEFLPSSNEMRPTTKRF